MWNIFNIFHHAKGCNWISPILIIKKFNNGKINNIKMNLNEINHVNEKYKEFLKRNKTKFNSILIYGKYEFSLFKNYKIFSDGNHLIHIFIINLLNFFYVFFVPYFETVNTILWVRSGMEYIILARFWDKNCPHGQEIEDKRLRESCRILRDHQLCFGLTHRVT